MSYPYGGSGYPNPPGHPVPPGYPVSPGYPVPAPGGYGYPPAPRPPSGGTGITAGIMAILGGLASALFTVIAVTSAFDRPDSSLTTGARRRGSSSSSSNSSDVDIDFTGVDGSGLFVAFLYGLLALLLLLGGFMLVRRSGTGRILVIVGSAAYLPVAALGSVLVGMSIGLAAWVFAVATLILASVGPTKRWIDAGRLPVPVAGGYGRPPYPTHG